MVTDEQKLNKSINNLEKILVKCKEHVDTFDTLDQCLEAFGVLIEASREILKLCMSDSERQVNISRRTRALAYYALSRVHPLDELDKILKKEQSDDI